MNSIKLQRASENDLAVTEGNEDVLSVWHSRLEHADRNSVIKMAQRNEARGIDMIIPLATNNC